MSGRTDTNPYRRPPWTGVADHVVPGTAGLTLALGRRADGSAAWLTGFRATPDGVAFTVTALLAQDADGRRVRAAGLFDGEDAMRLGVRFADGRETALDPNDRFWASDAAPPDGAALISQGARERSGRWDEEAWLWPLPPEGELTFTSSWGEDVVVDAAVLRDAAARTVELWPDDRPSPPQEDEDGEGDGEDEDDDGWLGYAPVDAGGRNAGPRRVPGAVGAAPVLARTDAAAAWLSGLQATPDELGFTIEVAWRRSFDPSEEAGPFGAGLPFDLRVELPDGRVVHDYGHWWDEPSDEPALRFSGGDGWNSGMRRRGSLRPLPGEGTLRFVVAWPAEGIEEAVAELDAALLREAADRAVVLWVDAPGE